ncbi:hypothetical protein EV182_000428 [Spiromyces aspiralis]|uniref:Uncharacterized protein n=1 Tax=Spiromyces aspiralis TaxID=68401 RepID=A0ACC1HY21_9FUNG|nr:hypothetical protein EV182_000428 [Spiromyces aspiralis]
MTSSDPSQYSTSLYSSTDDSPDDSDESTSHYLLVIDDAPSRALADYPLPAVRAKLVCLDPHGCPKPIPADRAHRMICSLDLDIVDSCPYPSTSSASILSGQRHAHGNCKSDGYVYFIFEELTIHCSGTFVLTAQCFNLGNLIPGMPQTSLASARSSPIHVTTQ